MCVSCLADVGVVVHELGQLGFSPELLDHVLVLHVEVLELLDRHRRASPGALVDGSEGAGADLLAEDQLLVVDFSVAVLALIARTLITARTTKS
jgi:hypothetical protein